MARRQKHLLLFYAPLVSGTVLFGYAALIAELL
jgi:hypothetical protein